MTDPPPPPPPPAGSRSSPDSPGRRATVAVLVTLALGGLFAVGLANQDDDQPTTVDPTTTTGPPCCDITYQVTGTAESISITIETPGGTSQQNNLAVPLRTRSGEPMTYHFEPGDFLYLSAQNEGEYGTVECRIVGHDGQTISEATSSGAYVIAGCDGMAG